MILDYQNTKKDEDTYPICNCCWEKYNLQKTDYITDFTPLVINCGHSICVKCCDKMSQKQQIGQGFFARQHILYKCYVCQSNHQLPQDKKYIVNNQLINFYENQQQNCQGCNCKLDSNNLPYFAKYEIPTLQYNNQQQDNIYSLDKVKAINKLIQCKTCVINQGFAAQKNYDMNQLLQQLENMICKNKECKLYYNRQFQHMCQCYYNKLDYYDQKQILQDNIIKVVENKLQEDYQYLTQTLKIYFQLYNNFSYPENKSEEIFIEIQNEYIEQNIFFVDSFLLNSSHQQQEILTNTIYDILQNCSQVFILMQYNKTLLDNTTQNQNNNLYIITRNITPWNFDKSYIQQKINIIKAYGKLVLQIKQEIGNIYRQIKEMKIDNYEFGITFPIEGLEQYVKERVEKYMQQIQIKALDQIDKLQQKIEGIAFYKIDVYIQYMQHKIQKLKQKMIEQEKIEDTQMLSFESIKEEIESIREMKEEETILELSEIEDNNNKIDTSYILSQCKNDKEELVIQGKAEIYENNKIRDIITKFKQGIRSNKKFLKQQLWIVLYLLLFIFVAYILQKNLKNSIDLDFRKSQFNFNQMHICINQKSL